MFTGPPETLLPPLPRPNRGRIIKTFLHGLGGFILSILGIGLVNSQLIPQLAYRTTDHCLPHCTIEALQNKIWFHFHKVTRLPNITPTKAGYGPTKEGFLGLFELPTRTATLTLTQLRRALQGEAPSLVCNLLQHALNLPIPKSDLVYSIAKRYVQPAEILDCRVFRLSKQPHLNSFLRAQRSAPPVLPEDPLIHKSTVAGIQAFSYPVSPKEHRHANLILHGCQEASELLVKYPEAWRAYTDGSGLHVNHNSLQWYGWTPRTQEHDGAPGEGPRATTKSCRLNHSVILYVIVRFPYGGTMSSRQSHI